MKEKNIEHDIKDALSWYKARGLRCEVGEKKDTLFVRPHEKDDMVLELSNEDISYRAELFRESECEGARNTKEYRIDWTCVCCGTVHGQEEYEQKGLCRECNSHSITPIRIPDKNSENGN